MSIFQITSAVIASKDTDGFTISLLPGKEAAFLPFSQLSDYTEVQELRKTALKAKDLLEELTLFKQKKQIVSFTFIFMFYKLILLCLMN